jgi:hypothetical protein
MAQTTKTAEQTTTKVSIFYRGDSVRATFFPQNNGPTAFFALYIGDLTVYVNAKEVDRFIGNLLGASDKARKNPMIEVSSD